MPTEVARHKTAMARAMLSRPMSRALNDCVITANTEVLDYGCGRGGDLARLQRQGIRCRGYDPVYRPQPVDSPADVVNLGYVVNVIEDAAEREQTLRKAWALSAVALVVSARLEGEARETKGAT